MMLKQESDIKSDKMIFQSMIPFKLFLTFYIPNALEK